MDKKSTATCNTAKSIIINNKGTHCYREYPVEINIQVCDDISNVIMSLGERERIQISMDKCACMCVEIVASVCACVCARLLVDTEKEWEY